MDVGYAKWYNVPIVISLQFGISRFKLVHVHLNCSLITTPANEIFGIDTCITDGILSNIWMQEP